MEAFFHFRVWELDGFKEPPFRMVSNGGICVLVVSPFPGADILLGVGHVVPPTEPYQKLKVRGIVSRKMKCQRPSARGRRCALNRLGMKKREAARTLARATAASVLHAYTGPGKTWLRKHVLFSRPVPPPKRKPEVQLGIDGMNVPPGVKALMREGKTEKDARARLGLGAKAPTRPGVVGPADGGWGGHA